jgi:hypothetical protein
MPLMLTGAGAAGSLSSFAPDDIPGLTYVVPGPATAFSDAGGTTPATVGGGVYTLVSPFGPAFTFQQATGSAQPVLRQNGSGKYYLEFAAGRFMTSTANVTPALNEPATLALALNPVALSAAFLGYLVLGSGGAGQYRSVWRLNVAGNVGSNTNGANYTVAPAPAAENQSWLVTTPTGAAVTFYRNGSALAGSGTPSHAAGSAAAVRLGHDGSASTGDWHCYGFGWRLGTAALTAGEVASLDAYQRSLYA